MLHHYTATTPSLTALEPACGHPCNAPAGEAVYRVCAGTTKDFACSVAHTGRRGSVGGSGVPTPNPYSRVRKSARDNASPRPASDRQSATGRGRTAAHLADNETTQRVAGPIPAARRERIPAQAYDFTSAALKRSSAAIRPAAGSDRPIVHGGAKNCRPRNVVLNRWQPVRSDAHSPDAGGNRAEQGAPAGRVESPAQEHGGIETC